MKCAIGIGVCAMLIAGIAFANPGHAVEPASVTITNLRNEAATSINAGTLYQGTSLLFTNCVLFAGTTTNSARQGLDAVTVDVSVGNTSPNVDYEATVQDTNGVWTVTVDVPSLASFYIWVQVTDENTNTFIYPLKTMTAQTSPF